MPASRRMRRCLEALYWDTCSRSASSVTVNGLDSNSWTIRHRVLSARALRKGVQLSESGFVIRYEISRMRLGRILEHVSQPFSPVISSNCWSSARGSETLKKAEVSLFMLHDYLQRAGKRKRPFAKVA